jgi:hypothetical protein
VAAVRKLTWRPLPAAGPPIDGEAMTLQLASASTDESVRVFSVRLPTGLV